MFDYDVVTGAVSAANEIGFSYLRVLETDCRRR